MNVARFTVLMLFVLSAGRPVAAQQPSDGQSKSNEASHAPPNQIPFRRLFVPADGPQHWPTGGDSYVPTPGSEFETLLKRSAASQQPASSRAPAIQSAIYKARWEGDLLLGESSAWRIVLTDESSELLPVATNLTLDQLRWIAPSTEPSRTAQSSTPQSAPADDALTQPTAPGSEFQTALLGRLADGTQALYVPKSGELKFHWSLLAENEQRPDVRFNLQVPRALSTVIELSLPADRMLEVRQPAVVQQQPGDGNLTNWRIDLGSASQLSLAIRKRGSDRAAQQNAAVRERLTYDISERGVELAAEFEFVNQLDFVTELEFALDPQLTVLAARLGETALNWSIKPGREPAQRTLAVSFERAGLGQKRVLRILGICPLVSEQRWQLPSIRPLDMFWTSGTALCRVLAPLMIEQVAGNACRQLTGGALPAPLAGESLELETFNPDHFIELIVRAQQSKVDFRAATSLSVSQRELVGRVNCRGIVVGKDLLGLSRNVSKGWVVDSVEAGPGTELAHWQIDTSVTPQQLQIVFATPPPAGQSLDLRLVCRRPDWTSGQVVRLGDLVPVQFAEPGAPSFVSLDLAAGLQLAFKDRDDLIPSDPPPADVAAIFPQPLSKFVYSIDDRSADMTLSVQNERPDLNINVTVDAAIGESVLSQNFRFLCQPAGGAIETLRVRFSPPPGPLRWEEKASDGTAIRPRLLREQDGTNQEVWEITLARPRFEEFELTASASTSISSPLSLSLAGVDAAVQQSGAISIRVPAQIAIHFEANGPEPMPLEPDVATTDLRAKYLYEPNNLLHGTGEPSLRLELLHQKPLAPAIVWRAMLFSRLSEHGGGEHRAVYDLENFELDELDLLADPSLKVATATLNSRPVSFVQTEDGLRIPLPKTPRKISLCLDIVGSALASSSLTEPRFLCPQPRNQVPIVSQQWHLSVPPGFEVVASGATVDGSASDTILSRLFGLVGAANESSRFRPLSREAWSALIGGTTATPSPQVAERLLQQLAGVAFGRQASTTWDQTITKWDRVVAQSGQRVFVEQAVLSSLGLRPQSPIAAVGPVDSLTLQAKALLRQNNLAVIVEDSAVVLTTAEAASLALQQGSLRAIDTGCLFVPCVNLPAADPSRIATSRHSRVPAAQWASAINQPWPEMLPLETSPPVGWTQYRVQNPSFDAARVQIVDRRALTARGWAVFIASALVGVWLLSSRRMLIALLAATAAIVALAVPASYSPIGSGLFLGCLLALLLSWLRASESLAWLWSRLRDRIPDSSIHRVRGAVTATVCLTLLLHCPSAIAAEIKVDQQSPEPYRVLIPVDDAKRPVGDFYYVPLPLRQALRERSSGLATAGGEYLLGSATYRGDFNWDASRRRLTLATIAASFELLTFSNHGDLVLPLFGRVDGPPPQILIDGIPTAVTVDAQKQSIQFQVAETGRHFVEAIVSVNLTRGEQSTTFEIAIPKISTASLQLTLPPGAPFVEIADAAGRISNDNGGRLVACRIGAVDRLRILSHDQFAARQIARPDVEELLWVTIQPGAVVLRVKYKLDKASGLDRFRIAAPLNLRLMPIDDQTAPVPQVVASNDYRQLIEFPLQASTPDRSELGASLLLSNASGVGHLQLPLLEPQQARVVRRWLAISCDPSLVLDESSLREASSATANEWNAVWGPTESPPQRVYGLPLATPSWNLATRPLPTEISADPHLALCASRNQLDVHYQARLQVASPRFFAYQMEIPASMRVKSVSVQTGKSPQPVRWSQRAGKLTIHLGAAPLGEQNLAVTGTISGITGKISLPKLRLLDAKESACRVTLLRESDTLISLANPVHLVPQDTPSPGPLPQFAGLSASAVVASQFLSDDARYTAELVLSPNKPQVDLQQLTRVSRSPQGWQTTVCCQLAVSAGVLDELRLKIPANWQGPFTCVPACQLQVTAKPDGQHELLVKPSQPVDGSLRLDITGPADGTPDSFTTPVVVALAGGKVRRYLALPETIGNRRLVWKTAALQPCQLPTEFASKASSETQYAHYELMSALPSAALADDVRKPAPVLRSHSITARLGERDTFYGLSSFDIDPAGHASCLINMPQDYKLVQALLDGIPAVLKLEIGGQWRVDLRSAHLPQTLEVLFSGRLIRGNLAAPSLEGQAARQILWNVRSADTVSSTASRVAPWDFAMLRLQASVAAAEQMAIAVSTNDLNIRMPMLLGRIEQNQQSLRDELALAPAQDQQRIEAQASPLQNRIQSLVGEVRKASGRDQVPAPSRYLASAWNALDSAGQHSACYSTASTITQLPLKVTLPPGGGWRRASLALLLIAAILLALRNNRLSDFAAWLERWPQIAWLVAGLAWWLFLTPSIIGCFVFFSALIALAARLLRFPKLVLAGAEN